MAIAQVRKDCQYWGINNRKKNIKDIPLDYSQFTKT